MTGASLLHDKDGATPSTIPQQWPAIGFGHATPIYRALCMDVLGSPLEYKREGPGPFLEESNRQKDEHTDRTTHSYTAWEQRLKQPAPPPPRLGAISLSHLACNPLLRALRCKEYKIDLSDWT